MPGYEKISKKVMVCATCDKWKSDDRRPILDSIEIEYEVYQKGECMGKINNQQMMSPLSKCKEWRVWKKMNAPRLKPMDKKSVLEAKKNANRIAKAKAFLRKQGILTTEETK